MTLEDEQGPEWEEMGESGGGWGGDEEWVR